MGSTRPHQYYCRCGTRLAKDNTQRQCARCQRQSRDKLITPPKVPPEFWDTEQFEEAFAARHMEAYAKASLKKYRPIAARNEDKKVCSGLL